jgi:hypothetical protein
MRKREAARLVRDGRRDMYMAVALLHKHISPSVGFSRQ